MRKILDTGMKDRMKKQEYRKYLLSFMSEKDPNLLCELGYEFYKLGEGERAEELIEGNCANVNERNKNAVEAVLSYFSERGMSHYDRKEYKKALIALNRFFLYLDNSKNAKKYYRDPGMIRDRIIAFDRCLELCNINDAPLKFEWLQGLDNDPYVIDKNAAYEECLGSDGSTDERLAAYRGMAYRLGCTLLDRESVESREKGIRYLENAADNGYPAAFTKLAEYYDARNDRKRAQEWCEKGIAWLGITEELREKRKSNGFEPFIYSDETINAAMGALKTLREKQEQYRREQTGENVTSIKEEVTYIHEDVRNIDRKLGVLTNIVNDGIAKYEVRMNDISEELVKLCEEIIAGNNNTDRLEECIERRFNEQETLLGNITSQLKSEIESKRTDYRTYYSKLEQDITDNVLPEAIWDSFKPKTRESIITAVMLVQMFLPVDPIKDKNENINFNCAVIPATCALEIEMKEKLYTNYIKYCEKRFGSIAENASKWPTELLYYNKSGIPKLNYKFTFGTFLGNYMKSEKFKEFLKARYVNDDADFESRLGSFAKQLNDLNAIRIPAAHSCIKRKEAEQAFGYILGIFENPAELRNASPLMRLLGELTQKKPETTSKKTKPKRR